MVTGTTTTGISTVTENSVIAVSLVIVVSAAAILPAAVIGTGITVITLGIYKTGTSPHQLITVETLGQTGVARV